MKNGKENEPIIGLLPPDPLHTNLLGPGNDAIEALESKHPHEMKAHYLNNYLKKSGEGPGGKFNGPSICTLLKECNLNHLETILTPEVIPILNFLRSLKTLHIVCTTSNFTTYKDELFDFEQHFNYLYNEGTLNMTPKIHVILDHYPQYFEKFQKKFYETHMEHTESMHGKTKHFETTHGYRNVKKHGTDHHAMSCLQSVISLNSLNAGVIHASEFRLRRKRKISDSEGSSPASSPWSSPRSSPRSSPSKFSSPIPGKRRFRKSLWGKLINLSPVTE